MDDRIRDLITDALEKAGYSYDTDGTNIWVDDESDGSTYSVSIALCES